MLFLLVLLFLNGPPRIVLAGVFKSKKVVTGLGEKIHELDELQSGVSSVLSAMSSMLVNQQYILGKFL